MPKLNWDDLRIFLAVARTGRNAVAASRLNIDHTTVTRRVAALESAIGTTLIHRSPRGIVLTDDGRALIKYAERIEAEAVALSESMSGTAKRLTGTVRLATPEAFGAYFIAPKVRHFADKHPSINLELLVESRNFSLSNREADIAIALSCPSDGRAVVHRLTDYRLGLYASSEYLQKFGAITELDELKNHPFIWYIEDLITLPQLKSLGDIIQNAQIVFRSTSITAQQNAVASGLGIGILHTFAASQDPRLVSVLPDKFSLNRSYWVTVHEHYNSLPRIRAVIDFLHEIVDAHRSDTVKPTEPSTI